MGEVEPKPPVGKKAETSAPEGELFHPRGGEIMRDRIKRGLVIEDFVPEKVGEYIKEHNLYV